MFTGILFSGADRYDAALRALEGRFGDAVMETPALPWDYSDYYRSEMGGPLFRRFVFFRNLISKDELAAIKHISIGIEHELERDGKRTVNIDPGYLTPAKLVLASGKNHSHRIYLKEGIYAEVTLMYIRGEFVPQVNTFKDYRDERFLHYFYRARIVLALLSEEQKVKGQAAREKTGKGKGGRGSV
jgi:hypothetical protein